MRPGIAGLVTAAAMLATGIILLLVALGLAQAGTSHAPCACPRGEVCDCPAPSSSAKLLPSLLYLIGLLLVVVGLVAAAWSATLEALRWRRDRSDGP